MDVLPTKYFRPKSCHRLDSIACQQSRPPIVSLVNVQSPVLAVTQFVLFEDGEQDKVEMFTLKKTTFNAATLICKILYLESGISGLCLRLPVDLLDFS